MAKQKTVSTGKPFYLTLLSLFSLATFVVVWQISVAPPGVEDWRIPSTLLASPVDVVLLMIDKITNPLPDGATLPQHAWTSFTEAFLGYIGALLVGVPLGLAMGWFSTVRGLFRPVFELIRPIPPVAWIPLTIFWFGIGLVGKVFIIWLSGLVPCIINAYTGVRMTNPVHIQMARTYGASNWQIFRTICVPSALPMVFGALQISLAYCWVTLVAAELLAADQGLGFLIQVGRALGRTDLVIVGMYSVAAAGAAISIAIECVEAKLLAGIRR